MLGSATPANIEHSSNNKARKMSVHFGMVDANYSAYSRGELASKLAFSSAVKSVTRIPHFWDALCRERLQLEISTGVWLR